MPVILAHKSNLYPVCQVFFPMPLYNFLDGVHQFGVVSFLLFFLPLVPPSGSFFNTRSVLTLTSGPILLQRIRGVAGLCKI